jgi:transcriptional regulator with XRE-family HTH domain
VSIGTRIRESRTARKLSLRDLGAKAGVTASFLSQVERGNVQPSIITLRRICQVLDLSMSDAFAEGEPPDFDGPRPTGIHVTRRDRRGQMIPPTHQVAVDMLVTTPGRPFEMLMVKLAPGMATAPELVSHEAREAMLVIEGRAQFESAAMTVALETGDTIYLNAATPHRMVNVSDVDLVFVDCIVGDV